MGSFACGFFHVLTTSRSFTHVYSTDWLTFELCHFDVISILSDVADLDPCLVRPRAGRYHSLRKVLDGWTFR